MDCPRCGLDQTRGARYCARCGMVLNEGCAVCGAGLPADARFCPRCGTAVAQDLPPGGMPVTADIPPGSGRERKVATLLFADLADFTQLSDRLDPEVVSTLVGSTFERLAEEVARFGGTLEKYAGDAILAVFGVPSAHEDDTERAIRAALEMQAVMARADNEGEQPSLALRIGVECGEVLVDQARAVVARDLFLTGDAVNTAMRLQQAASPGTIVVGPNAHAATRHIFEYREMGPLTLKGKSAPVVGWRAVAVRTRRGGSRAPLGLQAPFVGRSTEIGLLKETLRRAVADGRPHLVTVLGEAGVGKSRLAWELEKYLDGLPDVYHWRKGRGHAYASPAFGPIVEIIKMDASILDDDPSDRAREKLRTRLTQLSLGSGVDAVRVALETVLGIGSARELPREELFDAWRRYLRCMAELGPLVLVVEDTHWAGEGTLSFLDFEARWGEGPIILLCLARHELLELRPGWGGGLPNAATIDLERLSAEDTRAMLDGLLSGDAPASLSQRVVAMTEGNPLFVEEIVRMLVDRGLLRFVGDRWELAGRLDDIDVPGSVQAVLAARLDALPDGEKSIAQVAAVVGRIFWDRLVADLAGLDVDTAGGRVDSLRAKDLVVPREPPVISGTAEFGFRHVLVRDAAYDSLPKRDRARLHRGVADWLEDRMAERMDEFADRVAGHLEAALGYEVELGDSAGELRSLREATYGAALRAGRRAAELELWGQAGRWLRLAFKVARELGRPLHETTAIAEDFAQATSYVSSPGEVASILRTAVEDLAALEGPSDEERQALAGLRASLGMARYTGRDIEGALQPLREGIAELEGDSPSPGRARLLRVLGWVLLFGSSIDAALPLLERAREEAGASGDQQTHRWVLQDLGVCRSWQGRYREGADLLEESLRLATAAGDRALVHRSVTNLLDEAHTNAGDRPVAIVGLAREELDRLRRANAVTGVTVLAGNLAFCMAEMGRLDDAMAYADEAVAAASAVVPTVLRNQLILRSYVHRLRGDQAASARDDSEASLLPADPQPQMEGWHLLWHAWSEWTDEPRAATEHIVTALRRPVSLAVNRAWVAHETARMAFRLADRELLEDAVAVLRSCALDGGPGLRAKLEWIEALPSDEAEVRVRDAAVQLEELGWRRYALDAWADAALMAARAGRPSDATERALALARTTGIHPLLGPIPERRWLPG